jgi:predicted lysophospholipase L1 biosynthesis ABC-type transport system permease subunit
MAPANPLSTGGSALVPRCQTDCSPGAGAAAIGWALAKYAFEFDYAVTPWIFVLGIGGGAACALIGGWLGLRSVLRTPPLTTLREAR